MLITGTELFWPNEMDVDALPLISPREKLYRSLSILDSENIRVLDLLPASRIGKLRARLRVVPLSSKPEYEALSYTWGESTRDRKILLNDGVDIGITDNLFEALRRQRSLFSVRTLWIDALCINQADDLERSQQVPRMGLIYKQATCVNIWLGEPGFVFPFSLSTLYFISWRIRTEFALDEWRECLTLCFKAFSMHPEAMERAIENSTPRWHERVWVAQEYILTSHALFCFGKRRINEDLASWTFDVASRNARQFKNIISFSHRRETWRRISSQKRRIGEAAEDLGNNTFAEQGTSAVANCSSTDPRDRVYGMLGCIRSKEAALIPADYTLDCWQVFARATAACMVLDQSHSILQLVDVSAKRKQELPSWTVDFENVSRMLPVEGSVGFNRLQFFGIAQHTYLTHSDASMDTLRVFGFKSGTVVNVVSLGNDYGNSKLSDTGLSSNAKLSRTPYNVSQKSEACDSDDSPAINASDEDTRPTENSAPSCESFLLAQLPARREESDLREMKSKLKSVQHQSIHPFLPISLRSDDRCIDQLQIAVTNWIQCVLNAGNNLHIIGNVKNWKFDAYELGELYEYIAYALAASQGCCLFSTAGGLVGLAPMSVAVGDEIVLTQGYKFPFLLLRQVESHYTFRGLPFMHGLDLNIFPRARSEPDVDLASRFSATDQLETFELR